MKKWIAIFIIGFVMSNQSFSLVTTFANEANFQNELSNFTLINLDAPPLSLHSSGYRVEDTAPAADFANLGIDFKNFNSQVLAGQSGQIPKAGRDRLFTHGAAFGGEIEFDLFSPVNGVGALSNNGDGGRVIGFDSSGNQIAEASLGSGAFGGFVSTELIHSVKITCEFNGDLACGIYDIQFGTTSSPVPEPTTLYLFSFGLIAFLIKRNLNSGL